MTPRRRDEGLGMRLSPAVGAAWKKEYKVAAVRIVTGKAMEGLEYVTA